MAANIHSSAPSQSQAELRAYLEDRLRTQYPAIGDQEISRAVEAALGRHGYVLNSQDNHRNRHEQSRNGEQENGQQQALASVRDAAISAAQSVSDPAVRMAAIASAWLGYAATSAYQAQNQQRQNRR